MLIIAGTLAVIYWLIINYYDDKKLTAAVYDFIVESIHAHLKFGIDRSVVYCLGEGSNYKFLVMLNNENRFFERWKEH